MDVQSTVARFAPQTTYRAASTASASKRPSQEEQVFNKLAAFLLFAACLCFASIASAAVQEFGPDFHRFTIDVPQDWTAVAIDGDAHVTSVDQTCSLGASSSPETTARTPRPSPRPSWRRQASPMRRR
ncbi:MAG: hypothetical protein IIY31_04625 [Desulfovibrio sp.]|nr:hypothetical protein [Desulfovibrio sp.]